MGRKHKRKQITKPAAPNFLETHGQKIFIILLFLIPLIYFAQFLNPDKMIAGSDYLIGGYPFEKYLIEQPRMPLWYPDVFGGIPVLGAPVGGPLAPLARLREFIPPQVVLALSFIIFFFLAGLGTYLYLRAIGLSKYSAGFGAVAYQFAGNLATTPMAGHAGRAASVALFPLMLFFVHSGLKSRKFIYFILTALTTAFAFYEGHFQITYYALLFILVYVIYYLIARRKNIPSRDWIKIIGYGILAIILIFLIMAEVWLPVLGGLKTAARGVERGYEYAVSWAMPPLEIINLFVPTYSGILENYWGTNAFKLHSEYFGLLPIIFAIFAVVLYYKKPYIKFYIAASIVVTLIAWGGATPLFKLLYLIIPGFRLTRAPSLIFYLTSFSMIVVGAIGFEQTIINRELDKKAFIRASIILLIVFFLLIIIGVAAGSSQAGTKIGIYKKNLPNFARGIVFAVILIGLALAVTNWAVKRRFHHTYLALTIVALGLVSQISVMAKFLPSGPKPEKYYAPDDVVQFLKKEPGIYRVFPFPDPWYRHSADLYLLYHNIQSAGGYIPNPIQRYQEFIGAGKSVMFRPINLFRYPKLVDMLNCKYIIGPTLPEDISRYDPRSREAIRQVRKYLSRYILVYKGSSASVFRNDSALPRAYMVFDYKVAKPGKALKLIESPEFNPYTTVILEQEISLPHPDTVSLYKPAEILEYKPNQVVCHIQTSRPGFLVLVDNWHPDWKVYVDGREEKLYRANHTFRAVYISPGDHKVVFAYRSKFFDTGKILTLFGIILVTLLFIVSIRFKF